MTQKRIRTYLSILVAALAVAAGGVRVHRAYLVDRWYAPPPEGMVFVPAGTFLMGSNDPGADRDETPLRKRFLPAFYIDRFEVTNAEFKAFDPSHTFPEGHEDHPATGITRQQAKDYAALVGKRLPTKAEWEKAARGEDGREFPWGDAFRPGIANIGGNDALTPVGQYPESVSPYGAHDMVGNAWEWVEDTHTDGGLLSGSNAYKREIIKGGGYSYSAYQARVSYNGYEGVGSTCNDVGFRCAKDAN